MREFKVGDRVRLVRNLYSNGKECSIGSDHIGHTVKITNIDRWSIKTDGSVWQPYEHRFKCFELVEEGEKKMSEIGAGKLVVITGNTNYSANNVGDIGVTQEGPNYNGCRKVYVPGGWQSSVWTRQDEMEEVKELENPCEDFTKEVVTVVSVDNESYVVTKDSDDGRVDMATLGGLLAAGWTNKKDKAVTELTLEDVADKFNIDVKNLRIKE